MNLILIGLLYLCSFSLSQNYVYHFINESKSWDEAQSFCKKNYTDLATVESMTDMETLTKAGVESGAGAEAWIGLYNQKTSRVWHWSLPGVEFNEEDWTNNEDHDHGGPENCAIVDYWTLSDAGCGVERCFICYNAATNDSSINDKESSTQYDCINWLAAQHFCRDTHTDLISGQDQLKEVQMENGNCKCAQDSQEWWISLSGDTWGWSDGSSSSFRKWSLDNKVLNKNFINDNKTCVKVGPEGTFIRDNCTSPSPFICYDNLFILVKEKKTWEEALYYCRRNHRDLAWFMDHTHLKNMVQRRAQMANSDAVWVGLHYTCFLEAWIWVNGDYVSDTDENWKVPGESECGVAGAMERDGKNQWVKRNSWETLNFICLS